MAAGAASAALTPAPLRQRVHWSERIAHAALALVALVLLAFLAAPLGKILLQAMQDAEGRFVAFANFVAYARTPALLTSLWNSLWVSAVVTLAMSVLLIYRHLGNIGNLLAGKESRIGAKSSTAKKP